MPMNDLRWLVGELRALNNDLNEGDAPAPIVIALDQGGHASRAIAFEAGGALLAETFVPISTFRAGADRVEHDAREIVDSIHTALADLQAALGDAASRVVAAGLATQRSSVVCWDRKTGQPLSPVLSWQDRRNAAFVERLRATGVGASGSRALSPPYPPSPLGFPLVAAKRGRVKNEVVASIPASESPASESGPLPRKAGEGWGGGGGIESRVRERTGLVLSPHYGASKLRWCLDNIDAVRGAHDKKLLAAGPLASYLLHSLLTERPDKVDPANASRTQLWDPGLRDWSAALLELFGVPREVLPASVPSRHAFGHLPFAERLIPLSVCTGDQAAMPFASGELDQDTLYLNMGTGAFLQRQHGEGRIDHPQLLRSVLWSDDEQVIEVQEGTVNGAGSAMDWLGEQLAIDAHRAARAVTWQHCEKLAPPLFVNGIAGVGSPYWLPNVAAEFIGGAMAGDLEKVVAVLESIAFMICANLELMRDSALRRVLASGGLSASNYLCECIASLGGLTVERSTVREATATGLAFLVFGRPRDWRPVLEIETFVPRQSSSQSAALEQRYARWRELMAASASPPAGRPSSRR